MSPPLRKRNFISLFESGGDMGKVFAFGEVGICCGVRLSRPVGKWDALV